MATPILLKKQMHQRFFSPKMVFGEAWNRVAGESQAAWCVSPTPHWDSFLRLCKMGKYGEII